MKLLRCRAAAAAMSTAVLLTGCGLVDVLANPPPETDRGTPVTVEIPPELAPPGARPAAPTGEPVTVADVVDGDTFDTVNGRTIRVLAIDSCEAATDAGPRATADATAMLMSGQPVTLTAEPGVTTDQYGRELRYVQVGGADFGRAMVLHDHTAVYEGRNDANPAYVAELRALDPNGRTCDDPPPPPVYVPPAPDPNPDRDGSGDTRRRTGDSGHPCLPGERDGDGDGYCGEGR